jgi:hypothetical protein
MADDAGLDVDVLTNEFGRLLDSFVPRGTSAESIGVAADGLWDAVIQGGWLGLSEPGILDGADLSLLDIARFAVLWGRNLGPLPYVETLLAHRWKGEDAFDAGAAVTVALAAKDQVMTPRAIGPVQVLADAVAPGEVTLTASPAHTETVDDFAPSLVVGLGGSASHLSDTQRAEIRGLLAAEALGAAEECFNRAFEHAQIRIAYGRPISAFQTIRHLIADMHTDLDYAKTALYWALHSEGEENRTASTLCAQLCTKVGEGAFHIFGGMAFTWDLGLHLYQRHIEAVRDLVSA